MTSTATMDDATALCALEQAADRLFYQHGVVAVSMAQIRDESGVSLRRLYTLCPSKAELISLWLHHRHQTWMTGFCQAVEKQLSTGESPIRSIFSALAAWMTDTEFRGCGFINTHAESSELTKEHVQIIRAHKQSVSDYLDTITPHGAAIAVLVDGAIVQASIFNSTEPIDRAMSLAAGRL